MTSCWSGFFGLTLARAIRLFLRRDFFSFFLGFLLSFSFPLSSSPPFRCQLLLFLSFFFFSLFFSFYYDFLVLSFPSSLLAIIPFPLYFFRCLLCFLLFHCFFLLIFSFLSYSCLPLFFPLLFVSDETILLMVTKNKDY